MDIKEYISSGIIEQYALNLCNEEERAKLEQLLKEYPLLQEELREVEDNLAQYAALHAVEPPNHLRKEILDKVSKEKPQSFSLPTWLSIAASIVVVLSLGLNVHFYLRLNKTNEQLEALNAEKSLLSESLNLYRVKQEILAKDLRLLHSPELSKINLKATTNYAGALATIYYNKQTNQVFLNTAGLPKIPEGKQYQLWGIVAGKPVSAGLIPIDAPSDSLMVMTAIQNSALFAITIEPIGGLPEPTLSQMVVAGETGI